MMRRPSTSVLKWIGTTVNNSHINRASLHWSTRTCVGLMPDQNRVIHVHPEKKVPAENVIQKFAQHNKESLQKDFDKLEKVIHSPDDLKQYLEDDEQFEQLTHEQKIIVNPEKAAKQAAERIWKAGSEKSS